MKITQNVKKGIWMAALALSVAGIAGAKDLAPGKKAPDFTLTDINGKSHKLSDYQGKYVVLEWINPGCPFVKKHYDSKNMQALQMEMAQKDVIWLTICSSAKGKQGSYDADEWKKYSSEKGMGSTAILLDHAGSVGKLYGAKTTPHMFVINPQGNLIYRGAIDDKPSTDLEDVPGAKNYVRSALDEAMAGKAVKIAQTQSYGCSVKYK